MIVRKIRVLDPQLANKIAAGEVVERPASVVKELVENSLDAGSSAVTVEIRGGGVEYIRVTDNGCGIDEADVKTAFLRHATSKLASAEGLDAIETLGFRGEALASVAAVAHVSMRTRTEEAEYGTLIRIDGGEVAECSPCGCPQGTNIEVRELFYNVPARLKFLKSPRAEAAAVGDYMSRLILSNTGVSFKFISAGKTVYHSAGDGSLENAVLCVYGADAAEHIRPVSFDDGYIRIEGCCGDEYLARPNRGCQSLFVNGRYIRSQQLSYAAQRAYLTRLMQGRFPFLVLDITVSPREVDVNVHPNKLTVRFRDEERVASALCLALREALEGGPAARPEPPAPDDGATLFDSFKNTGEAGISAEALDEAEREAAAHLSANAFGNITEEAFSRPAHSSAPGAYTEPLTLHDAGSAGAAKEVCDPVGLVHFDFTPQREERPVQMEAVFDGEPYTVIGVAFDTYILIQQGENVFAIDQHAAHERINYERLIRGDLRFDSQFLLTGEVIQLAPGDFGLLTENIERFRELGFEIEEFGPLSVKVHAVPTGAGSMRAERMLADMLEIIRRKGSVSELDVIRGALIQYSCKHAIKAGRPLTEAEIRDLLSHYADGSTPLTCPHGRPVMLCFSKRDIEKMFKRIV